VIIIAMADPEVKGKPDQKGSQKTPELGLHEG